MSVTQILRPDRGLKAYRLHCRFTVDAHPSESYLNEAKMVAGKAFISDIAKQGWEYLDVHGITMKGPMPEPTKLVTLPSRAKQDRWQISARDALPAIAAGYRLPQLQGVGPVSAVPSLEDAVEWQYDLSAVFVHKTILQTNIEDEVKAGGEK